MAKTLQYVLYTTVCIVSLIIVFICFWWFSTKAYTKEDFIVPAPYVVMMGVSTANTLFYADIDVPMNPRWVAMGNISRMVSPNIGDIAGSYGKVYVLPNPTGTVYYGPYDSVSETSTTPDVKLTTQELKNIIVDDDGSLVGTDAANTIFYAPSATGTFVSLGVTATSVAVSGGQLYAVGTDGNLRYYPSSRSSQNPVVMSPGGITTWSKVSFDGTVCAIQTDGTLWCADANIGAATANWAKQGTQKFSQISIKGGRLVAIGFGTDTTTYYSNTYINPTWNIVPTQKYKANGAIDTTGSVIFKKVIMFYPALDARRKRFMVAGNQCGVDEEQIGNFCYGACASGRAAVGVRCPFRRKQTPPIPTCRSGEYINGSCYQPCPDATSTARGDLCIGRIVVKDVKGKSPSTPPKYSCGDGTVGARYVRIRPTNIAAVGNNKLCISKLVVKDKDGNILSLLNGTPGITSTIGSIYGSWINSSRTSIPITVTKTINIPGAGSSTTPLTIYVAPYGTALVMIADDSIGTAKYTTGTVATWTDSYWLNGTSGGTRASKYYMLKLHKNPVRAVATDGTCVDTPIGGGSCAANWSTYLSSTKYDTESDGGRASRQNKTYWDLDLGDVQQIRSIEFTGCNYVPASGPTGAAIDTSALSQPNADQITGMRIELLESENLPTTEPMMDRTLGPEISQTLTFNFLSKEPGIDDTCYDACPKINGVQSVDGGQQTCIAASGGITSRSVTAPMKLAPPVCSVPRNADGTPFKISGFKADKTTPITIGNWVLDPTNPSQALSCDVLPGSRMLPLEGKFITPTSGNNTPSTINYSLINTNGDNYTVPSGAPPYKCVILNDSMCASYGNYVLRDTMCVFATAGEPEMNSDNAVNPNPSWRLAGYAPNLRTDYDPCPYGTWEVGRECWGKCCSGGCYQDNCVMYGWDGCAKQVDCIKVSSVTRGRTYQYCEGTDDLVGGFCYTKCPDGYTRAPGSGVCLRNGGNPTWGLGWFGDADGRSSGAYRYKYGYNGWQVLKDIMLGRPLVSSPAQLTSLTSTDRFKVPRIPDNRNTIVDPERFPAQCKCLNADGTVNKQAYFYNNTCVKCADSNQLFYARGAVSDSFAWGDEQKNKFLSIYNDTVTQAIDQKAFTSLNDAKSLCETDSLCTGITRSYDANGTPYYYQRAGTLLKGTRPTSSGSGLTAGSGLSSAAIASGSGSSSGSTLDASTPTWDSSWIKGASGSTKVTVGLRKGTDYSTADIPTAFADDYISPTPRSSSVFSLLPTTVTNLVNSMANDMLQAASAWASFQNSVQNPNTYYQLVGVERQLSAASKPADNGICVAPCDPGHSLHDAIQMVYAPNASGSPLYVLYGTTCHDATQKVITKPNLPAIYTPQVGADCPAGYDLTTGGSCLQECSSTSLDSGSSCSENSVRRPSIAPTLTCATGLTLVGGVCIHPCGSGYTEEGDYCQPTVTTLNIPSSINCVKTPYTFSTKYDGSGAAATSVTKWLCDSPDDLSALLEGPSAGSTTGANTTTYVNAKDIVCYADDASTGMYYCQSVSDARNEIENTQPTDYSTSCDSMEKAYTDLSNNLTTLLSARTTAQNASAQTAAIQVTLQSVIDTMCGSGSGSGSGSSSATCNSLRTQLSSLISNINSGGGAVSGVLSPISVATSSRDNLITLLRAMKCCPAGETAYPWC